MRELNKPRRKTTISGPWLWAFAFALTILTPRLVAQSGPVNKAYVPNFSDGTVSVINTDINAVCTPASGPPCVSTATYPITVGSQPVGVAVTSDGNTVYVVNLNSNDISVIDTATDTVTATYSVSGSHLLGAIAVSPNGTIYALAGINLVALSPSGSLLATIPISQFGSPFLSDVVVADPRGTNIYVICNTNEGNDSFPGAAVFVVNTSSNTVTNFISIETAYAPSFALSPTNPDIGYFTDNTGIATVNLATGTFSDTSLSTPGTGLAITPDGSTAYMSVPWSNEVEVLRLSDMSLVRTIAVGSSPAGLSFTTNGAALYVLNQISNNVSVILPGTPLNIVIATITVGKAPGANGMFIQAPVGISGESLGSRHCNCDTPAAAISSTSVFPSVTTTGQGTVGEPVDVASGNMAFQVTDYSTVAPNPLAYIRYYNSRASTFVASNLEFGSSWRSNFDRYLQISPSKTAPQVTVERGDGQMLIFTQVGSTWTPNTDVDMTLTNSGSTWMLTDHNDTVETYTVYAGIEGLLTSIKSRNGYTQTLTYNPSNQLISVSDSYSRSLSFTYNTSGLLNTLTTPDSTTITFGYDSVAGVPRLISVTYPTSPAATQTYGYSATDLHALTSLTDENRNTYLSWTYDAHRRALTSQQGGGANLTTLAYSGGNTTVTNALGVIDTYKFTTLQGVPKVTEIDRAATATTAAATELFTYDGNGYTASQTDWNGNQTAYTNDAHGDPTMIQEAVGTTVERATTVTYEPNFVHLPKQVVTPGLTTNFTYDTGGELLTKTLTDTTTNSVPYSTNGQTRTWTNTWSNFLLASATTPNGNMSNFSYDASGALTNGVNALGQSTKVTAHTGGGLPFTVVDPNGVTTTLTYDARQRLLTSSVATAQGPRTTSYTYDPAGNLIRTTLPDGSALTNTYDAAHRLTTITDLFHQNVDYTLDALGDRTSTNLTAVGNRVRRQHSEVFDALGRMLDNIGGMGQTTVYAYDPNGNALTVTDPLGRTTSQVFDALNRLSESTDPNSGVTATAYDAHNRVVSVTDPNGNATRYTYDGFGDLIQQVSPDSGTTVYHYDADGNLTSKTDARGIVTNNSFDALDRILTTSYQSDPAENVAYTYDQPGHGFGIGRLTSLTDAAGSLSRNYDERANLLTDTRVNGTARLKTIYTYDAASRIASMTYPSGWTASYTRDIMGRIWQVPLTKPGGAAAGNAITNATYEPYGPIYTLTFGNGVNESRVFDLDYRITSLIDTGAAPLQSLTYAYDVNDNVSSIADGVTPSNSQTFGYDVLDRLTAAIGAYGTFVWTYDKLGNRLQQTLGAAITTYRYAAGSNRLSSITSGAVTSPVTYTAAGNITGIPPTLGAAVATITYNAANRLNAVTGTALAISGTTYDAFGQRFSKTSGGSNTLFAYGQDSSLTEEIGAGTPTDYVYLSGRPVAEITGAGVYFLHADQLGTPQLASDSGQHLVWSTTFQPFGATMIPVASITQNLRFPGQYFDVETGWDQNGWREYTPSIGRYPEADPSGLAGGLNIYNYAAANPLKWIDRHGLSYEDRQSDSLNGLFSNANTVDYLFAGNNCSPSLGDQYAIIDPIQVAEDEPIATPLPTPKPTPPPSDGGRWVGRVLNNPKQNTPGVR